MLTAVRSVTILLTSLLVLGWDAASVQAGNLSAAVTAVAHESVDLEVIAELDVDCAVESLLPDEAAVLEQRLAIAEATERVLEALGDAPGWTLLRSYETIPWLALRVNPATLQTLERSTRVRRVVRNSRTKGRLQRSVKRVRGTHAIQRGLDGAGWTVAVIDSGVDREHPFLGGRVVAEGCFVSTETCPNGTNRQTGPGAAAPCSIPDECSHGTHVAGTAVGRSEEYTGVAPGASLIAANVESIQGDEAGQTSSDIIAALEWVYSLRDRFEIASVNLSLGGGRHTSVAECDQEEAATKAIIDNLRGVGILTVAAAGNDGFADALEEPACISSIVSVGATGRNDRPADYSASAPFLDLLAPGGDPFDGIESATIPATGLEFEKFHGTSQATPHVAGAIAVLRQKAPGASPDAIVTALRSTGARRRDPKSGVTTPRLDVRAALAALRNGGPCRAARTGLAGGRRGARVVRQAPRPGCPR